ncbi:MAG: efflux RND transporter permease subunit [Verrucomicrobia bacterium]|nr:efflux RND transporter permease subunit [Verrucomicrobiota bacterium]
MIGLIAGAGIVVRNAIILVDFIELRLAGGKALEEAVIDAGAIRFRPMMVIMVRFSLLLGLQSAGRRDSGKRPTSNFQIRRAC